MYGEVDLKMGVFSSLKYTSSISDASSGDKIPFKDGNRGSRQWYGFRVETLPESGFENMGCGIAESGPPESIEAYLVIGNS